MEKKLESRTRWSNGALAAGALTVLYTLAAGIGAVATGNMEFVFYVAVLLLLAAAIAALHWRLGLSTGLLWSLAIWGGLHMAGGLVSVPDAWPTHGESRVLYSWWVVPRTGGEGWIKFDNLVHAYGFAVTTWLCWQTLRAVVRKQVGRTLRPTTGLLVIVAAASCGFGALNEIVEFIATLLTETNVGGYVNTSLDLIANACGAVTACVLIKLSARRRGEIGD